MSVYHDEVEIEDFEYDEDAETYYYPCPCGDRFEITKVRSWLFDGILTNGVRISFQEQLENGEEEATCPSCSLIVKVIYNKVSSCQEHLAETVQRSICVLDSPGGLYAE